MKKIIFIIPIFIITFILIFPRTLEMPQILNNVRAKNLCSCLFLEESSIERCRGQNSQHYPYYGEEVDYKNKSVSFSLFGKLRTTVKFEKDYGCRLKNSEH